MKLTGCGSSGPKTRSAPTRGPWIEILYIMGSTMSAIVGPTRGPWIEMPIAPLRGMLAYVGPHTGAVD